MNYAKDYVKVSKLHASEIKSLIAEFEDVISEMKGKCLDIGCGPGNNSRNLILPKLSSGTILAGIDISKNMIEHARIANADEKRMTFEEMNIETIDLHAENIENYDNGISFFCLHWIEDIKRCYKNIFKMLRPGGNALIMHLYSISLFPVYLKLAEDPRYKKYMKDVLKFIPSLYFEENQRAALKKVLQEVGFEVLHCSPREKIWEFKTQEERKVLFYIANPFVDRMPKNIQEEYIQNVIEETLKQETVFIKKSDSCLKEQNIFELYKFLMVHIKKPES